MTDRPALAQTLRQELEKECLFYTEDDAFKAQAIMARVLAEHETAPFRCHICGQPATCFGVYEHPEDRPVLACDTCCGHGNEDGWCKPVAELWTRYTAAEARCAQLEAEHERLRAALKSVEPYLEGHPLPGTTQPLYDALRTMRAALAPAQEAP